MKLKSVIAAIMLGMFCMGIASQAIAKPKKGQNMAGEWRKALNEDYGGGRNGHSGLR